VSDKTAASIGKLAGAQIVITGDLADVGRAYRLRVNTINAESDVREGAVVLQVRKDKAFESLILGLTRGGKK
jgi:hypothetical protein